MFGALVDGKNLYHEWYEKLNAHSFIEFIKRFVATLDMSKKYVFVFDNGPAHKAKISKEFLSSRCAADNCFVLDTKFQKRKKANR